MDLEGITGDHNRKRPLCRGVQGSELRENCVETKQNSAEEGRHVADKHEKRCSLSFGSRGNANESHRDGILHTCEDGAFGMHAHSLLGRQKGEGHFENLLSSF